MSAVALEVCVDHAQSLHNAVAASADRIELCSALELGGLTPSAGFVLAAAHVGVPVYAMIRPRAGDFEFTDAEVDQMIDDVELCREAGLAGIVIGASTGGFLDEATLEALVDAAGNLGVTLHRVFDLVDDPVLAIDTAADLGIERILTSGGARTALDGADTIRRFVEQADGRLSIMAGGGLDAGNAADIVRRTGVRELHGSFRRAARQFDRAIAAHGFATAEALAVADRDAMLAVRRAVDGL